MTQTELNDALEDAARKGDLPKVKEAIAQGADVEAGNDRALRWASLNGHLEVVKFLISQGADVRAGNDEWALRFAAYHGCFEIVKYLVFQGANLKARDEQALSWATENGHLEVANFLKLAIKVQEGKGSRMDKALYKIMMKEGK